MILNLKLWFLIIGMLLFQTGYSLSPEKLSMIGVYYQLEIDKKEIITTKYQDSQEGIRALLSKNKIRYLSVESSQDGIDIAFKSIEKQNKAHSLLQRKYKDLFKFSKGGKDKKYFHLLAQVTSSARNQVLDSSISNIIKVLKKRAELLGHDSNEITKKNSNHIEVRIKSVSNFNIAAFDTLRKTMKAKVKLELYMIDENSNSNKRGTKIVKDIHNKTHVIKRRMIASSENIVDSVPRYYESQPALELYFNNDGVKRLLSFKSKNIDQTFAVVLIKTTHDIQKFESGKVKLVERKIKTMLGSVQAKEIKGQKIILKYLESFDKAHELSLLLNSGTIISPYYLIEERSINSKGDLE